MYWVALPTSLLASLIYAQHSEIAYHEDHCAIEHKIMTLRVKRFGGLFDKVKKRRTYHWTTKVWACFRGCVTYLVTRSSAATLESV
jgi:hypothetical protein